MQAKQIGHVAKLTRYPFKSMAGTEVSESDLGWHGLVGDRRLAARLADVDSGFPWLSASRMPELLRYCPCDFDFDSAELLPKRIRTPSGSRLDVRGDRLVTELRDAIGCDVDVMSLKHGVFDDAPISVIAMETVSAVCKHASVAVDARRFRSNIVLDCEGAPPFVEDRWVGHVMTFGSPNGSPAVHVIKRDVRCRMINFDPDTAEDNPAVLKGVGSSNDCMAGVYGVVVRTGRIRVGAPVFLAGLDSV
jgi:uncharacterized protein YcbX